jgi:hypothetical protein
MMVHLKAKHLVASRNEALAQDSHVRIGSNLIALAAIAVVDSLAPCLLCGSACENSVRQRQRNLGAYQTRSIGWDK